MMRDQIGATDISDEMLAAYFDGELSDADAERVAAAIDADAELRGEFEQLGLLGGLVQHGLARKANQVPQARFEQIWDEIDRAIANDARTASEPKEISPSIWGRVWAAFKPLRVPAIAAAAAAAVTVYVVGQDDSDPNKASDTVVEVTPSPSTPEPGNDDGAGPQPMPAPVTKIADANPVVVPPEPSELAPMEVPDASGVEIHNIDLGGGGGRISNTGTVTVLYLDEEPAQADSERSL